ncbi:MAG: DUF1329 domain-containing protein [Gammaproteobacteria bacterium]|nr:DUF1329 domain-containing protein [Gammaproteobacteria bacterium]
MSIHKHVVAITSAALFTLAAIPAAVAQDFNEKPSAAEIAKLGLEGTELTPAGAIRAGNAEGTIPEWKNEPIKPPPGWQPGTYHADPFADDKVVLTINAQNYQQYADKLSAGHIKMFETYPDYVMNIYPTRRSAVFKPYIYQAALENAGRARVVMSETHSNLIGFEGAVIAWAFPIPKNGPQAIMNQVTRPVEPWKRLIENTTPVTSSGDYQTVKLEIRYRAPYSDPENTIESFDPSVPGMGFYYYQTTISPAKQAGQVVLAREPLSFSKQFRQAWGYSPGQRRVKRAPQIVYDNPMTSSDGLATTDQKGGFNGPNDRFEWKLVGRKEMYVPYNAYRLWAPGVDIRDMITPQGRLNQDLARYELHRVWEVEATLREGTRHDYGRRTFFYDEDTWAVMLVDGYDRRGQIWRLWEEHGLMFYDQGIWASFPPPVAVQYDLSAGRMLLANIDKQVPPDFNFRVDPDAYFTPAQVRRDGVR